MQDSSVYLVGGGLASLASAFYLIRDTKIKAENIHILEQDDILGGSLDGSGNSERGFLIRGGRMHEAHFVCYWDLLSSIPSFDNPSLSIKDETFQFNNQFVSNAQARLIKHGQVIRDPSFGLSLKQKLDLSRLSLKAESKLDNLRIEDWFDLDFFETNFWYLWTSMFAFQRWSSLIQMRRYMRRFIHLVDGLPHLRGIMRTKYNQYHSVVVPLERYLREKNVQFELQTQVKDVDFDLTETKKTAVAIHVINKLGKKSAIKLNESDYVFITNGSITDGSSVGSWSQAPTLKDQSSSGAWTLWKTLAKKDKSFGQPSVFCDQIDLQKWYSFTVTLESSIFTDYMQDLSGNIDGTGGLVTLCDSNWLMSFVIARQPHFPNQPDNIKVFWGYGLYADKLGNKVKKKMSDCSGREILEELWFHLNIEALMMPLMEDGKINCLPVALPFIDSLFMPYAAGDRPEVVPTGATNFAFLGQFAEVPKDCVFTVEYSVRTAHVAVTQLFNTKKRVPPVYDSIHKLGILMKAIRALSK